MNAHVFLLPQNWPARGNEVPGAAAVGAFDLIHYIKTLEQPQMLVDAVALNAKEVCNLVGPLGRMSEVQNGLESLAQFFG